MVLVEELELEERKKKEQKCQVPVCDICPEMSEPKSISIFITSP